MLDVHGVNQAALTGRDPEARLAAVGALTVRCQESRSAPALLVPLLEPLVRDPRACDEAVLALRRCGRAAARYAGFLGEVAAASPELATRRRAVETLMLLGDPRWVDPVVREGEALLPHSLMPLPWPSEVRDAVRRRLAALTGSEGVLCEIVARWGTEAADVVPELLGALPHAPQAATRALLAVGHLGAPMVPGLRAAASRPGGLLAATALFRLTGDPAPALRALLTARPPVPPGVVALLGPLAMPLVPEFELLLTGEAADSPPQCAAQLLAAQVVIAATGDTTAALPTLHAVLTAGGHRAVLAAAVVADLAGSGMSGVGGWRGEMAVWKPELRELLDDPWAGVAAAGALWRLGAPAGELVPVVVRAIEEGRRPAAAVSLLHELGAAAEAARLAARDERLPVGGADDDIVINDELLRDRLLATAASR
ncbi:hypothetical protein [Couchioplanes caeruleus]|uniref:HEAT repeat protein n=2 Tax=Couchioplanes caeruleus TaxID=56438 RepID=A0A1K0FR76_9ACTN|nr:hypothetical protein [Couchioplanes caeruleus]OJF15343.1 hypothetical protein BG844_04840 [Couchioplanes caeruleus subsp. caeruleus]ROP29069.1 hypothetical protein EDD30_1853 [Couchioplanes caeruleus]